MVTTSDICHNSYLAYRLYCTSRERTITLIGIESLSVNIDGTKQPCEYNCIDAYILHVKRVNFHWVFCEKKNQLQYPHKLTICSSVEEMCMCHLYCLSS